MIINFVGSQGSYIHSSFGFVIMKVASFPQVSLTAMLTSVMHGFYQSAKRNLYFIVIQKQLLFKKTK